MRHGIPEVVVVANQQAMTNLFHIHLPPLDVLGYIELIQDPSPQLAGEHHVLLSVTLGLADEEGILLVQCGVAELVLDGKSPAGCCTWAGG